MLVCLCVSVCFGISRCGGLSPLNMSRLCQTRQSISETSSPPVALPRLPPSLPQSALLSCSVSPSLSVSFHPSRVQFFISGSIFFDVLSLLLRRHSSLPFCLPPLACQSVVPALSLSLSLSFRKSISFHMWWQPVNRHQTVRVMRIYGDLVYVCWCKNLKGNFPVFRMHRYQTRCVELFLCFQSCTHAADDWMHSRATRPAVNFGS